MSRGFIVSWLGSLLAFLVVGQACVAAAEQLCASKLARLRGRLEQAASETQIRLLTEKEAQGAPVAERGRLAERSGPVVVFSKGHVALDELDLGLLADEGRTRLKENLATLDKHWGMLRPGEGRPHPLYVVLDPGAGLHEQAQLLTGLGEEWDIRLVVRVQAPRVAPPGASQKLTELSGKILRMEASKRAVAIAKLAADATLRCAPLVDLFMAPRGPSPKGLATGLLDGAADAAATCGCDRVDVDALEVALVLGTAVLPACRWLPWPRLNEPKMDGRFSNETVAELIVRLVEAEPGGKASGPACRPED